MPLNPSYKPAQVIGALNHVTAACLIISAEANLPFRRPASTIPTLEAFVDDLCVEKVSSREVPSLEHVIIVDNSCGRIDTTPFKSLICWNTLLTGQEELSDNAVSKDDVALIQFTSGTTSAPKGACLTNRNLVNIAINMGRRLNYTEHDTVCCPTPLFHVSGTTLGLAISQCFGATLVFPSEAFNTAATVEALRTQKCTAVYGVPTMYVAMLEYISQSHIRSEDFKQLRTGIISGAPVHASLLRKVHDVLYLPELAVCWGMSETAGAATMSHPYDPCVKRVTSVGRTLPHTQVRVVSRDDPLRVLPVGERGELVVAGYLLMKGYWNDPAATAAAQIYDPVSNEIWMRTGDEGVQDADGFFQVTGRIKDVIIRGGENIHPAEIESILVEHARVMDASVVGIPDEKYGEIVGAFVVLNDASGASTSMKQELQEWVGGKLGKTWVPREVFVVEDLPKTASGKVQKFELREKAKGLLALTSPPPTASSLKSTNSRSADSHARADSCGPEPEEADCDSAGWDNAAGAWSSSLHRATTLAAGRLIDLAEELRPITEASRVIDVGAGTGAATLAIAAKTCATDMTATDISQSMLDNIHLPPPTTTSSHHAAPHSSRTLTRQTADVHHLTKTFPPSKKTYTHTFSNLMLHVLSDPLTAVHQMHAITDPAGGILALSLTGKPIWMYHLWQLACQTLDPTFLVPDLFPTRWCTPQDLSHAFHAVHATDVHIETFDTEWPFANSTDFVHWFRVGGHPGIDFAVQAWKGDREKALEALGKVHDEMRHLLCLRTVLGVGRV